MRRRQFVKMTVGMTVAGGLFGRSGNATATGVGADSLQFKLYEKRRRFLRTPFGQIAYLEAGHVDRVALFLHGFPLNSFQWRDAIARLSMFRRCIAPDFMGLGFTKTNDGQDVGPQSQVAMLISFLDRLKIRSVDVVANDSGGAIAQLLAVKHPERVRSLLLTNCDTEVESPPAALLPVIELAKRGRYADEWLVPWLADKALARSDTGIGGLCYCEPGDPTDEAIEMYFRPLVASPQRKALVEAYVMALEKNPLAGIETQLRRSTMDTRIVWGMSDTIFSASNAEYLNRLFSRSRGIRRIDAGKLFWPEEYPQVLADEAAFLWTITNGS